MIGYLDRFLNKFTMYQVVLYGLIALVVIALVLAALGRMPFTFLALLFSVSFILFIASISNALFAWAWDAPSNYDSVLITGLILALIILPPSAPTDAYYFSLATVATAAAMASKYLLAIGKRHLFNPAAFGVALTALLLDQSASWWIGSALLAPAVAILGFLIVRKIRRFDLVLTFLFVSLAATFVASNTHELATLTHALTSTFLLFFAGVMLTEPYTTPHTQALRMGYGALMGLLAVPGITAVIGGLSPEEALVIGNLIAYAVSPKEKLVLALKETVRLSKSTYEFVFSMPRPLAFSPGEYMEWTLPHEADSRGVRRYFSLASAPGATDIRIGVRIDEERASSFKRHLKALAPGGTIVAAARAGDFTLPEDTGTKLAFIAGGIGITPFASMLRDMLARGEKRPVSILYASRNPEDAAYADLLTEASATLSIPHRTLYSDAYREGHTPEFLSKGVIQEAIPDYAERTFYISGPEGMVNAAKKHLSALGVPADQVKLDYFPGFA